MKRKTLKTLGAAFIAVVIAVSCTEKMNIKLDNAAPQLVIEGIVTNDPYCAVLLSKSTNANEPANNIKGVSNALVVISDNTGNKDTLQELTEGFYQGFKTAGVPGRTYFLEVKVENKTYTASSTMPEPVEIDSVKIEESTGSFMNPDNKRLRGVCYFKDPAGIKNYYKLEAIKNGKYQFSNTVFTDRLWDGKLRTFFVPSDSIVKGDTLTARLLSIDQNVYEYFLVLRDLNSLFNKPAAPANPPTNISPTTLGYFSAHTVNAKTIIVE